MVNGLTGFGTALTVLGIWLYAIPPTVAATLVILCSVMSQLQTLPMIWRSIRWEYVLAFVVPGLLGVPIGTYLLPHIDPRLFKIGIGVFLVAYTSYVLMRRAQMKSDLGRRGGRLCRRFRRRHSRRDCRIVRRASRGLDRRARLDQGASPRRRADLQYGDTVAGSGFARRFGIFDAPGGGGGDCGVARHDRRRVARCVDLPAHRRSQLFARHYDVVADLRR